MTRPTHLVDMDDWPRSRCGINLRNPPAGTSWVATEHADTVPAGTVFCHVCRPPLTLFNR